MERPDDLQQMILEIENSDPQKVKASSTIQNFKLKPDDWLVCNLSGNDGAFYVRAMLHQLNVNEHHVFKWRLENKYIQYQIFNYYFPGCMPESLSFSRLLNQEEGKRIITNLISQGFFIKATLGDASLSTNSWDKTAELNHICKLPDIKSGKYERYMLQKRLHIKSEFRVHTFSKEIIPALSYWTQGLNSRKARLGIEKFVNEVLRRIPEVILIGTLIAWDIALTNDDQHYIIEANFTGFHPEYRAGFQTTGYVDDHTYGATICAWLNTYFSCTYGTYVDSISNSLFMGHSFYQLFDYYLSIFKDEHVDLVRNKTIGFPFSAIIYLGQDITVVMYRLIKHFLLVDFAGIYRLIVRETWFSKINDLFSEYNEVQIWAESKLYTKDQFQLIRQLGYDRRKQTSCYHCLRSCDDKYYVII